MGRINKQQMGPLSFELTPPLSSVLTSLSQSSYPLLREEIAEFLKKLAVERVQEPGTPAFIPGYFLFQKRIESYVC